MIIDDARAPVNYRLTASLHVKIDIGKTRESQGISHGIPDALALW